MKPKEKIVVYGLDDDPGDLELFRRSIEKIPTWTIEFNAFTQWEEFRAEIGKNRIDVLFVDFFMKRITGLDVVEELRQQGEKRPIIVLTGMGDERMAAKITRAGADDYLVKGELSPDLLRRTISNAMERFRSAKEKAVLEKQLQEAHKMETLGTLVGGIAHDFNNLLMSIMGYADFAKMKSKGRDVEADLDNIITTSQQMANLVKQLLSFSRQEKDIIEITDLGQVLSDAANILKHSLPKKVKLTIRIHEKQILIMSNPTLLNQIILNLCINASEAMPSGGKITVQYRTVLLNGSYLQPHPTLCEGPHVLLEIEDTGMGIPQQIQGRIFEPFFTTKQRATQKGTGLGLAIVWNNIKKMNGSIEVFSEPGAGTVFKLYFPITRQTPVSPPVPDVEHLTGQKETILAVDDESLVLSLLSRTLKRLNYKVLKAKDGQTALEIYKERMDEISLVLLDISMPGMDGRECMGRLLAMNPEVIVIFSSGHDLKEDAEELKQLGCAGVIQKPYFLADLGKRIKEALNKASAG